MNLCIPSEDKNLKHLFFAVKIDMMKAYERVEWKYLEGVINKMGFSDDWIKTIMRCVTNVQYA